MNREIKFRVWDDKLKITYSPDNQIGGLWSIKESHNGIVKYEDGILMQFTGLQDKNGKDIYEGDILKAKKHHQTEEDFYEIKDKVRWHYGGFEMFCHSLNDCYTDNNGYLKNFLWCERGHLTIPDCYYEIYDIEIIGNIYENPELMEG